MAELTQDAAEQKRLVRLAAKSLEADALLVEFIFHDRWVRFDISGLELQHVPIDELWRRHIAPALKAIKVPPPVLADPEPAQQTVMEATVT